MRISITAFVSRLVPLFVLRHKPPVVLDFPYYVKLKITKINKTDKCENGKQHDPLFMTFPESAAGR